MELTNSTSENIIFIRLMNINFVKRNFFKSIVETKAHEGLIENAERWLIVAKNLGIFTKKETIASKPVSE